MDIPCVELNASEADRAYQFFQKLGEDYPREYNAPDPKTGQVRHGATFYHDFGQDAKAATTAVLELFATVFGLPADIELLIEEN
jgi:hypothetical protein